MLDKEVKIVVPDETKVIPPEKNPAEIDWALGTDEEFYRYAAFPAASTHAAPAPVGKTVYVAPTSAPVPSYKPYVPPTHTPKYPSYTYEKKPNGTMPFKLGAMVDMVYGGPYDAKPDHMTGVKLDPFNTKACDVDLPIKDYGVPASDDFKRGLTKALSLMAMGKHIYVGCMAGHGRTGLFLAGLAKVMIEHKRSLGQNVGRLDPIGYVRLTYHGKAVENETQRKFIDDLDVSDILKWWTLTQPLMFKKVTVQMIDGVSDEEQSLVNRGRIKYAIVDGCNALWVGFKRPFKMIGKWFK